MGFTIYKSNGIIYTIWLINYYRQNGARFLKLSVTLTPLLAFASSLTAARSRLRARNKAALDVEDMADVLHLWVTKFGASSSAAPCHPPARLYVHRTEYTEQGAYRGSGGRRVASATRHATLLEKRSIRKQHDPSRERMYHSSCHQP